MARGIQLKQLTRENLELLGLPEDAPQVLAGDTNAPGARIPQFAGETLRPADQVPPSRRPIGPPPNPASALQSAEAEPDLDWQPLDLRALARELRSELELTLRLLAGDESSGSVSE